MKKSGGFSLVEIMVGMTVGLLGMIVIFQVFSVSESNKRSTTSGGDAMQNGAIALYNIERDARMAGFGFNDPNFIGCTVDAYDNGPPTRDFSFTLAPLLITQGADNDVNGDGQDSDAVTIMYGNSGDVMVGYELITSAGATDAYEIGSQFGFTQANGELFVLAQPGTDCTLGQIVSTGMNGGSFLIQHGTGNYVDENGVNQQVRYNKIGGLGNSYTNAAKLFKLGALPQHVTYSIGGGGLSSVGLIQNTSEVVADGIVNLQAQYGIDTGADGIVDAWQSTLGAAAPSNVIALRVALVAKVSKREPTCDVTTAQPTWSGGTFNLGSDPEWQCFRYKVFQTTVPLRSMIWRPT